MEEEARAARAEERRGAIVEGWEEGGKGRKGELFSFRVDPFAASPFLHLS